MHFGYTGEQEQFRDIVARFLRERSPMTAVRVQMASERGHDPASVSYTHLTLPTICSV